jgi:hypothetical protein
VLQKTWCLATSFLLPRATSPRRSFGGTYAQYLAAHACLCGGAPSCTCH